MDKHSFRSLLTPNGAEALQAAAALEPREEDFLRHFQRLSKQFERETARAALETAILRRKAAIKFPNADQLFFTREALEQASSHEVSRHRAKRFEGLNRAYDLGCSIGRDTMALAEVLPTVGVELDPLRAAMARQNLMAFGLNGEIIQADITKLPFDIPTGSGIFLDPARRSGHRRIFNINDYQPPLSIVNDWVRQGIPVCVKISPGVKLEQLAGFDCEVEFVSLNGNLKEAVLWFGRFKTTQYRATMLPDGLAMQTDDPASLPLPSISPPQAYIHEPDSAILRAGLVTQLAADNDAHQLDPEIAYLTSSALPTCPWLRSWPVEEWFPFGLKRLKSYLVERDVWGTGCQEARLSDSAR